MSPREFGVQLFRSEDELDLTSGSIVRPLFYLSLPIVVMNLLQTTYNLVDTFWLGQYATAALAATSFTFPMVMLYISVGLGISAAGSIRVAQHLGAGERSLATKAASQTLTLAVIGPSPEVLELATVYMRIISPGLVFVFGFIGFARVVCSSPRPLSCHT